MRKKTDTVSEHFQNTGHLYLEPLKHEEFVMYVNMVTLIC